MSYNKTLCGIVGPLIDGEALDVVTLPVLPGQTLGLVIGYHAEGTDGTETVGAIGQQVFGVVNKNGVDLNSAAFVSTGGDAGPGSDTSVLQLSLAWQAASNEDNKVTVQVAPTWTGTPTRSALRYEIKLLAPVATISNPV